MNNQLTKKRVHAWRIFSALCIMLSLLSSVTLLLAEVVPPEVKTAAEKGFRSFLKAIPADDLSHFNFSNVEEVQQAVLGAGFRVHTIPPDLILNYDGSLCIQDMIRPTPMWFFPVISKGEVRTLITVDLLNGEYKTVSIGSSGLSKQWAQANKNWPQGKGYKNVFVTVYQTIADFVVVSDPVGTKMAPLNTPVGKTLTTGRELILRDPTDVILDLQDQVRDNMGTAHLLNGSN